MKVNLALLSFTLFFCFLLVAAEL